MNFLQLRRQPGIDTNREYFFINKTSYASVHCTNDSRISCFFVLALYVCYIISLFHYVFLSVLCICLNTTSQFTTVVLKHKHYFCITKSIQPNEQNNKIQVQKEKLRLKHIMGADVLVVREKEHYNNTQYRLCTMKSYFFTHFLKRT